MKKLIISILVYLISLSPALALGAWEWDHTYGATDVADRAAIRAVNVDSAGNVIAVGSFVSDAGGIDFGGGALVSADTINHDVIVIKYDSAGVFQWAAQFGSTGSDIAYDVGTDSSNNIYVMGVFAGTVDFGGGNRVAYGGADIFLLKLNSSGVHQWSQRFGGTGNETAEGIAVKADGTNAITGSFGALGDGTGNFGGTILQAHGSNADIFVASYDSSGTHIFSKGLGGTGTDTGLDIAIDASSGAIVVGATFFSSMSVGCTGLTSNGDKDAIIIKYTSAGLISWMRQFGGTSADNPSGVSIDSAGNVIVAGNFLTTINFGGTTHTNTGGADLFIAKYTSGGVWTWDNVYGDGGAGTQSLAAVALDGSNNISITGSMIEAIDFGGGPLGIGSSTVDVFIAKYNSSGTHIWSARYTNVSGTETSMGNAMTSAGGVVIVGNFDVDVDFGGGVRTNAGGLQSYDGFVAKFLP